MASVSHYWDTFVLHQVEWTTAYGCSSDISSWRWYAADAVWMASQWKNNLTTSPHGSGVVCVCSGTCHNVREAGTKLSVDTTLSTQLSILQGTFCDEAVIASSNRCPVPWFSLRTPFLDLQSPCSWALMLEMYFPFCHRLNHSTSFRTPTVPLYSLVSYDVFFTIFLDIPLQTSMSSSLPPKKGMGFQHRSSRRLNLSDDLLVDD